MLSFADYKSLIVFEFPVIKSIIKCDLFIILTQTLRLIKRYIFVVFFVRLFFEKKNVKTCMGKKKNHLQELLFNITKGG